MGVRRMVIGAPCPACGQANLVYTAADLDVPYFGQIVETIIICGHCGFKHGDVIVGKTREPLRYTYRITRADDMMVRVVRSTSGTMRVPELGVRIEPGAASEAFVSNVEGVLVRIERVLRHLERDAEDTAALTAIQERLAHLEEIRRGARPATLILEDPYGNSLIAHEGVHGEPIPPEDARKLSRGEIIIDLDELEKGDGPSPGLN